MLDSPKRSDRIFWTVVHTHANKEHVALEHLARQHFQTYCPQIRKSIRHARRMQSVDRPMFPGYVFVRVAPGRDQWRPILSTVGVKTLVRVGNEPGLLDDALIEGLKARERDGVIIAPETPYQPGQQVRLTDGPFGGAIATILTVGEKERLLVLMSLLRGTVRVTIPQSQVAPIHPTSGI